MLSEKIKNILEDRLFVKEYLTPELEIKFYEIIFNYLKNRTAVETFDNNLRDTVSFYEIVGVSYPDMIKSIMNWPSIIHADKNELFKKYLLLALVVNSEDNSCDRDNIIVNHPKDLMTGFDTIYARIMHLSKLSSEGELRTERITRRKLFKITNSEFEQSYGLSKEDLLRIYPVNGMVFEVLKQHNLNKELVEKYGKAKN